RPSSQTSATMRCGCGTGKMASCFRSVTTRRLRTPLELCLISRTCGGSSASVAAPSLLNDTTGRPRWAEWNRSTARLPTTNMLEGIEAQRPGREVGAAEYAHICHRYWVAGRIAEGRRTVELACGPGLGTAHLGRVAALYVAGDLSAEHLALARRARPVTLLLRMRAERLPIASEWC